MAKESPSVCPNQPCPGFLAVVAIGNRSRQDDGTAAVLLQQLRDSDIPGACLIDLGPYTSYLAGVLKQHKRVLIIDTAQTGQEAGDFTILQVDSALAAKDGVRASIGSSHGLSFFDEVLLAARDLKDIPSIALFLVEPGAIEWQEGLSDEMRMAIPALAQALRALVEEQLAVSRDRLYA